METYGQRYSIEWTSFLRGREMAGGEVKVRPTKPMILRGIPVHIRSHALNAADRWLRSNRPKYAHADAWVLKINPVED